MQHGCDIVGDEAVSLFESIPTSFIKGAFLDRIHLYNPGWEIRMLKKESFSKGYGFITCGCVLLIAHLVLFNKEFFKDGKK